MSSGFGLPETAQEWQQELDRVLSRPRAVDWSRSPDEFFSDAGLSTGPTRAELVDIAWYGPIQQFISNAHTPASDVLINGNGKEITIITQGRRRATGVVPHPKWIEWLQTQLALQAGLVTPEQPNEWPAPYDTLIGTARRKLRFACTRPPLSPAGPTISLRVLPDRWPQLEDLIEQGVMTGEVVDTLTQAMQLGATMLICGGTGSGKTTCTSAFLQHVGKTARVVVIEEASELPELPDSLHMEVIRSHLSFSDCVRLSLRQKPDYVAVGEVRSGEAMALLQAAATGHPGIGTIHAADVQLALKNLERMATEEGSVPATTIRGMIGPMVPMLVVHIGWYGETNPRRCVGQVVEVIAGDGAPGEKYTVQTIFEYHAHYGSVVRRGTVQGKWANNQL